MQSSQADLETRHFPVRLMKSGNWLPGAVLIHPSPGVLRIG